MMARTQSCTLRGSNPGPAVSVFTAQHLVRQQKFTGCRNPFLCLQRQFLMVIETEHLQQCICGLSTVLTINSYYFLKQR
jgi:hypothetical protein